MWGVDVNASDNDGWTPLVIACSKNDVDTVTCLIKAGADANVSNKEGSTPMMRAFDRHNIHLITCWSKLVLMLMFTIRIV